LDKKIAITIGITNMFWCG